MPKTARTALFRDLNVGDYFVHEGAYAFEPRQKVSRHRKAEVSEQGEVTSIRKGKTRGDSVVIQIFLVDGKLIRPVPTIQQKNGGER